MRWIALLLTVLICSSWSFQTKSILVVIDAGHGGNDPGHLPVEAGLMPEKDINLKIANYLGGYISKYMGNVRILYTRQKDQTLSLDERVDLANNNNADYFISVHCNGNPKRSIYGTESHIHNFQAKGSYNLALDIEKEFSTRGGRRSRGVKNNADRGHSVQVLKFTKMTSVLVECGFVTNKKEANYLNTTYGQEIIASAIFRGFRSAAKRDFPNINFEPGAKSGDYIVRIMSSKGPIDTNHESFKRLKMEVHREKINTTNPYKYTYWVGPFSDQASAVEALRLAQKRGFPDAILNRN